MQFTSLLFVALMGTASAHVAMQSPLSFNDPKNPAAAENIKNVNLASPVGPSTYPCNTNSLDALKSAPAVETWKAGDTKSITFPSGGAAHGGGSCEVSIAQDDNLNFIVIKKVIGNCPQMGGSLPFTLPAGLKSGRSTLAWSWFNYQGNREMYMNCAIINIEGGSGSGLTGDAMFVANVNGVSPCATKEGENPTLAEKCCRTGAPDLIKAPTCPAAQGGSLPGYNAFTPGSGSSSGEEVTQPGGGEGVVPTPSLVPGNGMVSPSPTKSVGYGSAVPSPTKSAGASAPSATGTGLAGGEKKVINPNDGFYHPEVHGPKMVKRWAGERVRRAKRRLAIRKAREARA